jgi:hypothetical protein
VRYSRHTCSIGRSASGTGFGGAFAARVAAAADAVDLATARGAAAGFAAAFVFAAAFGATLAPATGAATPTLRERLVAGPVVILGGSAAAALPAPRSVGFATDLPAVTAFAAAARPTGDFDLVPEEETDACSRTVLDIRSAP